VRTFGRRVPEGVPVLWLSEPVVADVRTFGRRVPEGVPVLWLSEPFVADVRTFGRRVPEGVSVLYGLTRSIEELPYRAKGAQGASFLKMTMGGLVVFIEPGVRKTQDSVEDRTCLDTQHVPGSGGGVYRVFPMG
jgi:hypothetical protein